MLTAQDKEHLRKLKIIEFTFYEFILKNQNIAYGYLIGLEQQGIINKIQFEMFKESLDFRQLADSI